MDTIRKGMYVTPRYRGVIDTTYGKAYKVINTKGLSEMYIHDDRGICRRNRELFKPLLPSIIGGELVE